MSENIIRTAREADLYADRQTDDPFDRKQIRDEHFAALVRADERELCTKACEELDKADETFCRELSDASVCAATIRGRGLA